MSAQELTIWSMALGAVGGLALARLAQFVRGPSLAQLQGVGYHTAVFLLVLILSGVAARAGPAINPRLLHVAQVLAGPLCVGLSDLWIRRWLHAPRRDRLMASALWVSAAVLPLAGLACLALPQPLQLPAAAALSLLGSALTLWLTARAWLLGDALAPLMAAGCALTLPAIAGLYAVAMQVPGIGAPLHVLFALCAACSNALTGLGLWRRDRHEQRARRQAATASQIDPVTQVHTARSFVKHLVRAQGRRHRAARDGAVLAVLVFEVERLRNEAGTAGLNDMFIGLASRIQRQVGAVNVVGRYYEGCFVTLVESIHSAAMLRRLALRLAARLRQPLEITLRSGARAEIEPDIGVGVVRLSRPAAAVEDVLADAQRTAQLARTMASRAAIWDPRTGEAVAVERALLGPHRRRDSSLLRAAS